MPSWSFFTQIGFIPEIQVWKDDQWTKLQVSTKNFRFLDLFFNPHKNLDHYISTICHLVIKEPQQIEILNNILIPFGSKFRIVNSSNYKEVIIEWSLS